MSNKHPPNPARFDVYTELPDRSGFTIKDTEFVFKFDRYGGWFDEYGNYYDCDGVPGDVPSDSESYHSEDQHSQNSHDDEEDQFQKQFGGPGKSYSDEQDETEDIHFSKIAANLVTLNSYPSGKPFRINFRNLPYASKRNEVFEYFRNKIPGILNVIFLQNEKKQFNGNGYFLLEDGKSGENLIRLEGEKYSGREISFSLDSAEDFILEPIKDDELYLGFPNKKASKSFVTKEKPVQKQELKKQQFPQLTKSEPKVEIKPQKKQQSPVKVQKKIENEEEFASYIFERKPFPKKSSFKQWINNNNFSHENDIKQVSKIEGDQTRAKVTMKRKIFNALNGKIQNGIKVVFQPTQK